MVGAHITEFWVDLQNKTSIVKLAQAEWIDDWREGGIDIVFGKCHPGIIGVYRGTITMPKKDDDTLKLVIEDFRDEGFVVHLKERD